MTVSAFQIGVTALFSNAFCALLFKEPLNGPLQLFAISMIIEGLIELKIKAKRKKAE